MKANKPAGINGRSCAGADAKSPLDVGVVIVHYYRLACAAAAAAAPAALNTLKWAKEKSLARGRTCSSSPSH
jgi:hypothetical protein